MSDHLRYHLALTQVPLIGNVLAKTLLENFGTAEAVFKAPKKHLVTVSGISDAKASAIRSFSDWALCEREIVWCEKNNVSILTQTDTNYPRRLLNCYDPPTVLFYKGNADLNAVKMISVVGTRSVTPYGKTFVDSLIEELSQHKVSVVSGLAFGVDTLAHRACVKHDLPTIGVVAHGLHTIYPSENVSLANKMQANGGILTELWSGEQPDKHNFPVRNRIVAGMSDALVVVETDTSGGSMITATLADGYNRDIFALPGRINDAKSRGCNQLILREKARMITCAQDLLQVMNWLPELQKKPRQQRQLFINLDGNEKHVFDILNEKDQTHIDELKQRSGLPPSSLATVLLSLELEGVIITLPGNLYRVA